ncbi:MAG: 6-phosphogluconolactonase [Thermoleophilaceae bacterium]|jgi:6-phosphogluconolactonase|nr:6-phosphogluconolactonase [Thermoleophilaceae bacterium]
MDVHVLEDPAAACAEMLVDAARAGQHISLTGGSTPGLAYEQAASLQRDWSRATLWWGDDRCVPPDDELSNYRLAKEALLDRLPPEGAPVVHRIPGEQGAHAGADDYDRELRAVFGDELPRIDFMLLGLGPDAHVASLYPGQPTLDVTDRLAVGVDEAGWKPYVPRVSMTMPVLCAARRIVFLVAGDDKAEAVGRAFGPGVEPSHDAPGSMVRPIDGELILLLDEAAASHLPVTG